MVEYGSMLVVTVEYEVSISRANVYEVVYSCGRRIMVSNSSPVGNSIKMRAYHSHSGIGRRCLFPHLEFPAPGTGICLSDIVAGLSCLAISVVSNKTPFLSPTQSVDGLAILI